jgi:hypothetical protein
MCSQCPAFFFFFEGGSQCPAEQQQYSMPQRMGSILQSNTHHIYEPAAGRQIYEPHIWAEQDRYCAACKNPRLLGLGHNHPPFTSFLNFSSTAHLGMVTDRDANAHSSTRKNLIRFLYIFNLILYKIRAWIS